MKPSERLMEVIKTHQAAGEPAIVQVGYVISAIRTILDEMDSRLKDLEANYSNRK